MNINLKGKSALVCGSTQGIGKAIALELADLGANVILMARNQESLEATLKELANHGEQSHDYIQADFSDSSQVEKGIKEFLAKNDSPVILINNTGGPSPGALIDEDYSKFEKTFSAHVQCNHLLTQALVPGMKEQAYGRIINVISTSVYVPIPGLGVSNTTRGAVASWAKTLSIELGQYGITVNNVLPGLTDTGRLRNLITARAKNMAISDEEMTSVMKKDIPAGRFGDVMEIASLAGFLASPAASYINGVSIPVDGGKTGCI